MSEIESAPIVSDAQEEVSGFTASRSLGELLLPILVISMEICLVDALLVVLASFRLMSTSEPLLPLWLPFCLSLSLYWLKQFLQRGKPIGEARGLFSVRVLVPRVLLLFLAVFMLWFLLYAQLTPLFLPTWVQSLASDAIHLNQRFDRAVFIFVLICAIGWRGVSLTTDTLEITTITHLGRLGLSCLLGIVLVSLFQGPSGLSGQHAGALLLLIPAFLFLLLLAQALYKVSYVRRFHSLGLQGSARRQEQLILQTMLVLGGVVLLLMFLVASLAFTGDIANVALLLSALYHGLLNLIFQFLLAIGALVGGLLPSLPIPAHHLPKKTCTPGDQSLQIVALLILLFLSLLWLARTLKGVRRYLRSGDMQGSAERQKLLLRQAVLLLGGSALLLVFLVVSLTLVDSITNFLAPLPPLHHWLAANVVNHNPPPRICSAKKLTSANPTPANLWWLVLLTLLIVLFLLANPTKLLVAWLWSMYRKMRTRRDHTAQGEGDIRESVWSWSLFLSQLKALLVSWPSFLKFFRKKALSQSDIDDLKLASPAARTIREIYRAFLKKAARKGYVRAKDETPHEFRRRVNTNRPLVEPQLEVITNAYVLTRYGGVTPNEQEVATIRQRWHELEKKWETSS